VKNFYVYGTWGGRLQWRSLHATRKAASAAAERERGQGVHDAYVEHAKTGERFR
jgi:hypothetical protein